MIHTNKVETIIIHVISTKNEFDIDVTFVTNNNNKSEIHETFESGKFISREEYLKNLS